MRQKHFFTDRLLKKQKWYFISFYSHDEFCSYVLWIIYMFLLIILRKKFCILLRQTRSVFHESGRKPLDLSSQREFCQDSDSDIGYIRRLRYSLAWCNFVLILMLIQSLDGIRNLPSKVLLEIMSSYNGGHTKWNWSLRISYVLKKTVIKSICAEVGYFLHRNI